jgi:hypothetical protein
VASGARPRHPPRAGRHAVAYDAAPGLDLVGGRGSALAVRAHDVMAPRR